MRAVWNKTGDKTYETGVDRGIFFPKLDTGLMGQGYVWDGLTAVNEAPTGAEPTPVYASNSKYLNMVSAEEWAGSIEGVTYPVQFMECDGTKELFPGVYAGQQARREFGFAYRSLIGNDVMGNEFAYKLHLVYNCLAAPTDKAHTTINETPEATPFTWDVTTTPVEVTEKIEGISTIKPIATYVIDSRTCPADKLKAVEDILYGKDPTTPDGSDGVLPKMIEVNDLIKLMAAGG